MTGPENEAGKEEADKPPETAESESSGEKAATAALSDSENPKNDQSSATKPESTSDKETVWSDPRKTDSADPKTEADKSTESVADADSKAEDEVANKEASSLNLTQHHVSHLLSDVLQDNADDSPPIKGLRFPMILDLLLGLGLLVAVGGFTVGLFHMYIVHSASQCISESRYKAAIVVLKAAPLPQLFTRAGSDTEELLSKALYLDAMDKLESGTDVNEALKELAEIGYGSKYFTLAQEAINENTEPATMMLQGGAETTETNPAPEKESLLEKTLKEEPKK